MRLRPALTCRLVKILHILPALSKGGTERVALDLANAAVAGGHEAALLLSARAPDGLLPARLDPQVAVRRCFRARPGGSPAIPGFPPGSGVIATGCRCRRDPLSPDLVGGAAHRNPARAARHGRRTGPAVETNHGVGLDNRKTVLALLTWLHAGRSAVALMAVEPFWRRFIESHPLC